MQYATIRATMDPMVDTDTRRNDPVWNKYRFQCPHCERTWEPNLIRIKRLNGTWACHRCYDNKRANRTDKIAGTRVAPTAELAATNCWTCNQPLGHRRIVVNVSGNLVHYRCPKKRRQ